MRRFPTVFFQRNFVFILLVFAGSALAQTPTSAVPDRLSASFSTVAKSVEPAVVSIDTKGKMPDVASKNQTSPGTSDDIMDFLRKQIPRRPSYSVGSGFLVDRSGYILTNNHVIEDAARITVKLVSGEEYSAKVVGTDEETDLAVLKIEAGRDLPFVKLGDSEKVNVGDWVLAIGSPFGLTRTVTAGIISQVHRETPYGSPFQRFIQTDAAINRGNSGGPLVNMDGDVIGINSQIATSTGDYNGVGFALPSTEAKFVYEQLVRNGKVRRGFLGVNLDSVKAEFASVYGLKQAKGAIVTDVRDPNSAAGRAGLAAGDVIVEFNGESVENAEDLIKKVSSTPPDQAVGMVFLREAGSNMDRRTTSIRLGERPSAPKDDSTRKPLPVDNRADSKPFGLTLVELTPAVATTYKLDGQKGLLVKEVNPESFIADVKTSSGGEALGEGDVIQRINRVPVQDTRNFAAIVSKLKKGDAVVLHVVAYNPQSRAPQLKIVQFTVQ